MSEHVPSESDILLAFYTLARDRARLTRVKAFVRTDSQVGLFQPEKLAKAQRHDSVFPVHLHVHNEFNSIELTCVLVLDRSRLG